MADETSSFDLAERCIESTAVRINDYPLEQVRITRLVGHIQRSIELISNRILKPYGLTHSAYTSLMMMYGSPDHSIYPSQLSDATGEGRTNITRICDELESRQLVTRIADTKDRRKISLKLTEKGCALVEVIQPSILAAINNVFEPVSDAEQARLLKLLRKMLTIIDKERDL